MVHKENFVCFDSLDWERYFHHVSRFNKNHTAHNKQDCLVFKNGISMQNTSMAFMMQQMEERWGGGGGSKQTSLKFFHFTQIKNSHYIFEMCKYQPMY